MRLPKLPETEVSMRDWLYTEKQMKEYGKECCRKTVKDAAILHRWLLSEYDWTSAEHTKQQSFDEFVKRSQA